MRSEKWRKLPELEDRFLDWFRVFARTGDTPNFKGFCLFVLLCPYFMTALARDKRIP